MLRVVSFSIVCAVLFVAGVQSTLADDALAQLSGSWSYRSFRHEPIKVENGEVPASTKLAIPWAPKGNLELKCDKFDGKVTGLLRFGPAALDIDGEAKVDTIVGQAKITADATLKDPTGKVVVTYRISGYLIDAKSPVIVGNVILASGKDLGPMPRPVGTAGAFVASVDK